ncbi:hypothetical protein Droror1_Dr00000665 [Drosera rotundifolia]
MDASDQWQQLQEMELARAMEEIRTPSTNSPRGSLSLQQRKLTRPQKDQSLNCPRCNSTKTKFCYYNNYSLTQPRYFCKACRRYWTQGGSLRSVPVGGGSRKNKRTKGSSLSSSTANTPLSSSAPTIMTPTSLACTMISHELNPPSEQVLSHELMITSGTQNPIKINHDHQQGHDLNLAFSLTQNYQGIFQPLRSPKMDINTNTITTQLINSSSSRSSALELLRTGIASRGSLNPYLPMATPMAVSNALYPSSFPWQDFKPNLSFSDEEMRARVGTLDVGAQEGGNGARFLFPFREMKQLSSTSTNHGVDETKESHEGSSTPMFWNGRMGC